MSKYLTTGRPPNALEFERRLLGALLLHPEIIAKFRALGLRPDQLWGLVPSRC